MFVPCSPFQPSVMQCTILLGPFITYKENDVFWIRPQFFPSKHLQQYSVNFQTVVSYVVPFFDSLEVYPKPGNTNLRGMLSTVDLPIQIACLIKKKIMLSISKAKDLNWLIQGGQLYWAFPLNKGSLPRHESFLMIRLSRMF